MILTVSRIKNLYRRFDSRHVPLARVNIPESLELFRKITPDTEVVLFTRTDAREVRPSNPYGPCLVVKRRVVIVNKNYAQAVNERRAAERKPTDFQASGRAWGESLEPPFVLHQTVDRGWRLYLSAHVVRNLGAEYFDHSMRPIPFDSIREYLKPPRPATRQGLRKEVQYRNWDIFSVLAVFLPGPRGGQKGFVIDTALPPKAVGKSEAVRHGLVTERQRKRASTRGVR